MKSQRSVAPRRARPDFSQPPYVAPRYHSRIWGRLIFAVLILGLGGVFVVGGGLYWFLHHPQGSSSAVVPVHVGVGDTVTSIADRLQREGVINSPLLFRIDAHIQNLGNKLKVGDYSVRRNMSIDQMVAALTIYHSPMVRITIPEGERVEQIAARLQARGINGAQFLQVVRHPDAALLRLPILRDKPVGRGLEGYLFPNTYQVPPHYGARAMAEYMLKALGQNFTPTMRAAAARRGLSVYQVLTLASIVEREARVPGERAIIASVYLNRLNGKGWVLNADPTVQYAVGRPRNWWPVLTTDQLKVDSPYNTYLHPGLPPSPIANAGLASIEAVIYPAPTTDYYFVAKNDCRHHAFAQTYGQQLLNQQKYHCQA